MSSGSSEEWEKALKEKARRWGTWKKRGCQNRQPKIRGYRGKGRGKGEKKNHLKDPGQEKGKNSSTKKKTHKGTIIWHRIFPKEEPKRKPEIDIRKKNQSKYRQKG